MIRENEKPTTLVNDVVHTPGPWLEHAPIIGGVAEQDYRTIKGGDGLRGSGFELTGFISEADAKLISAAPELLAALRKIRAELCRRHGPFVVETDYAYINQAIEKATK